MRQGVICMLIAALVLQLAGGVVAGGAEPLAMTTQETIRTVAVSGVPTALMRGARLPERMPSFHTDAACHLADSWQSWSGMVWFSSPDGEHISKPLPAGTVTEPLQEIPDVDVVIEGCFFSLYPFNKFSCGHFNNF